MKKKTIAYLACISLLSLQPAIPPKAAQVGSFHARCEAPNWQTGQIEVVEERNVPGQAHQQLMAFTHRMPGGHWLIEYNIDRIMRSQLPDDVMIFIFYHECAHAQHNTSDEGVADCEALAAMRNAGEMRNGTVQRLRAQYQSVGRTFPSAAC